MFNKISFRNYKAFASGEIKIRPITILLGANSVGKSSIMQLILLLQQTALSEKKYNSALKLHGGYVSMGEGLNLIRKKDSSKVLSINIEFNSKHIFNTLKFEYIDELYKETYGSVTMLNHVAREVKKSKKFQNKYSINDFFYMQNLFTDIDKIDEHKFYGTKKKKIDFECLINDFFYIKNVVDSEKINTTDRIDNIFNYRIFNKKEKSTAKIDTLKTEKNDFILTYNFLKKISENIVNDNFNITYDIINKEKTLFLSKVTFFNDKNVIFTIDFGKNFLDINYPVISSQYIDRGILHDRFLKIDKGVFDNTKTIFSFSNDQKYIDDNVKYSLFLNTIIHFSNIFNDIASYFFENDNINYVSPLRAHPKRYYFLDKAKSNAYLDTLDGDAIAEILKKNISLKKQVNSWLKKFNLEVNVEHLEDIIHKLQINQNSLDLDITDVGFGISQVLPVIIQGFLSHDESLTIIEQPEIHLHPKMQADLADLLIEIAFKDKIPAKCVLVETHSEYLLKRLRRRISEKKISSNDVAIYLIDPDLDGEGAAIKELTVEDRGQFDWPVDFYGGELLSDTTEFIKNQYK